MSSLSEADHPYYDGCISGLTINSNKRNIRVNYQAKVGTVSGCRLVKRSVSFLDLQPGQTAPEEGYVQVKNRFKIS